MFNFFNQRYLWLEDLSGKNFLQVTQGKQSVMWLASPTWKNYDSLNLEVSGYKLTANMSIYKTLSYFNNYFFAQWTHIAFRGKSYRIRNFSRRNKFTFNFGYSHWTRLKLNRNWAFFKRRRQCYVIYTWFSKDFFFFTRFFPNIRFYNCYTMRGLRLRKQPIIRRFGKISQHISILH